MNFLIGADPEVFVRENGALVSGFNLVPGTKENPYPVQNGAVQVDGMALEFNISPASTVDEFLFNIQSVMAQLSEMIPGKELDVSSVAHFGEEYMSTQPPEALLLGCDPDFNAYTGAENQKPDVHLPFRTAAGHVHIGWTQDADPKSTQHLEMCMKLTRQLDYFLALPSLFLDTDDTRRKMYGAAGAFRPKSYGVEYRVLSNFWLREESLMRWVYNNVFLAIQALQRGEDMTETYGSVEQVINTANREDAKFMLDLANIPNNGV